MTSNSLQMLYEIRGNKAFDRPLKAQRALNVVNALIGFATLLLATQSNTSDDFLFVFYRVSRTFKACWQYGVTIVVSCKMEM